MASIFDPIQAFPGPFSQGPSATIQASPAQKAAAARVLAAGQKKKKNKPKPIQVSGANHNPNTAVDVLNLSNLPVAFDYYMADKRLLPETVGGFVQENNLKGAPRIFNPNNYTDPNSLIFEGRDVVGPDGNPLVGAGSRDPQVGGVPTVPVPGWTGGPGMGGWNPTGNKPVPLDPIPGGRGFVPPSPSSGGGGGGFEQPSGGGGGGGLEEPSGGGGGGGDRNRGGGMGGGRRPSGDRPDYRFDNPGYLERHGMIDDPYNRKGPWGGGIKGYRQDNSGYIERHGAVPPDPTQDNPKDSPHGKGADDWRYDNPGYLARHGIGQGDGNGPPFKGGKGGKGGGGNGGRGPGGGGGGGNPTPTPTPRPDPAGSNSLGLPSSYKQMTPFQQFFQSGQLGGGNKQQILDALASSWNKSVGSSASGYAPIPGVPSTGWQPDTGGRAFDLSSIRQKIAERRTKRQSGGPRRTGRQVRRRDPLVI